MLRAVSGGVPPILDDEALRQVDALYEHLDDAGLNPVVDEEALRFDLAPCQYHDLLDEDQELVCGVHAQLVRDVLQHSGGPLEVQRLDPFVSAHRCMLMLTRAESGSARDDQ